MKLLAIKIGKAFSTLRREGILRGGKRVFQAFFALFRLVGKGDILFVTGGVGDSARYRCDHVAEELELQGFKCSITVQDNPFLPTYSKKFKVFIFHRVLFSPSVQKLIESAKKQGKEIIFETDDLVYDPKCLSHMDFFLQMNFFEKKLYENGVGGEILADPYVKVCTTTTSFLADKLRAKNKRVFIVPNKLTVRDLEVAEEIMKHVTCNTKQVHQENKCHPELVSGSGFRTKPGMTMEDLEISNVILSEAERSRRISGNETRDLDSSTKGGMTNNKTQIPRQARNDTYLEPKTQNLNLRSTVRIGYFSGTISHNKDFATITEALLEVMRRYENVELFLVGPLETESKLKVFSDRIQQLPLVPREKHFKNIASVDINVVPLEYDNPFCEAKSELKFFEAGIVGVPTVAVANRTHSEAISDGVDGFLVKDTAEWTSKLEKLILDENLRKEMGKRAREKALSKYTTENADNKEYYGYLRNKIIQLKS